MEWCASTCCTVSQAALQFVVVRCGGVLHLLYIDCWQHKSTMSRKTVFEKIAKPEGHMSHCVDICVADTGTYYDYYWQNHDKFQWCKQNATFSYWQ